MKSSVYILILLLFTGCSQEGKKDTGDKSKLSPLVQKELDKRIKSYSDILVRRCKEDAYKRAVNYVDSIIVEELRVHKYQDLDFPERPTRPKLPETIILEDSI